MEKSINHMKLSNKILIATGIVFSLLIFITMVKIKQIQAEYRENQTIGNKNWTTHEMQLSEYDKIDLGHHFKVNWHKGEARLSIKIEENLRPYLKIDQDGQTLKIRFDNQLNYESSGPMVVDLYSPKLSEIRLSEFVVFNTKDTIQAQFLKFEAQDHCKANILLKTDSIELQMFDFCKIDIGGKAALANFRLNDHSTLDADQFVVDQAIMDMNDFTDASLIIKNRLKAQCMDHSNFEYRGDSVTAEIQQRDFSKVRKKDF
jgi:hypothetical protein